MVSISADAAALPWPGSCRHVSRLLLIVLVVLALAFLVPTSQASRRKPSSAAGISVVSQPSTDGAVLAVAHGTVVLVHVKEGDTVVPGQVLLTLSSSPHAAALTDNERDGSSQEAAEDREDAFWQQGSRPAPEILGRFCNHSEAAVRHTCRCWGALHVRMYYLHPDRILRNGAPCLASTQMPDGDLAAKRERDYVKDALDKGQAGAAEQPVDCQGANMRVATAAEQHYFPQVLNFIGSVHYWEPQVKITVYDMGFTPGQRAKLAQLSNVSLRRLPLERLPPHFAHFSTYAFKPFLFLDALRHFPEPCLLWQDSGQEFRRDVAPIRRALEKKGLFLVKTGWQHPTRFTNPRHLVFFGLSHQRYVAATAEMKANPEYEGLWEAAGGIIGATRSPRLLDGIILPWAVCTFYRACVSPAGTDRTDDRQDQTALNMIMYYRRWKTGPVPVAPLAVVDGQRVPVLPEPHLDMYSLQAAEGRGMTLIHSDPTKHVPGVVLFSRKKFPPQVYTKFIKLKSSWTSRGPEGG